ncbi:MAG: hypothetical protein AB7L66_00405 [Gemmatimonadales bacterium]
MGIVREARLRPEYSHLYPELPPDTWMAATEVGATILMSQLRAMRPVSLGDRLLPEEHFEFRGGADRGFSSGLRTRRNDPGPAHHQH